jgi:hypothetical protein
MGPVSAETALVAVEDRSIDGAAGPPHAHTAPASDARHHEREEKGEEPRGRDRESSQTPAVCLAQKDGHSGRKLVTVDSGAGVTVVRGP